MEKKKIVIIMGTMGRGGAERVISLISDYFINKGWEVWIGIALIYKVEYKMNPNIHFVDLTGNTESRIKRVPYWIRGIRHLVKSVKPNVVLSFAARVNILTKIACIGIKTRLVVSERNDPRYDGRGKMVNLLTKILYPRVDCVVFQTKRAAEYFSNVKMKKSCIISNPINVPCFAENMKIGKIVTAGRLTPQKNQELIINAFSSLINKYPNSELYIYGEGELRSKFETKIVGNGLKDKIHLPGNVEDIHQRIRDANIFVLSSDFEGLSNMLLEAMMMGIACISTECAGADEYIVNGKNGILIGVGKEEELINAIDRIFSDVDTAIYLGQKARESSKAFEKYTVLKRWYEVITFEQEKV